MCIAVYFENKVVMLFHYIGCKWRKSPKGFWKMVRYLLALCCTYFENIGEYRCCLWWFYGGHVGVGGVGMGGFRGLWRAFEGTSGKGRVTFRGYVW